MATGNLPQGAEIIGAKVPRIDGALKTTGSARYAVDHQFPRLAHAVAVQSTIGKGRIQSLDVSAAEKMPGVLLVLHHGTMEGAYRFFPHQEDGTISEARPPFEDEQIYYWGQFVAVVVAETLEQAKEAARAVKAEYSKAAGSAAILIER
jgi:xanthine dehydrogenase YagR molybdenum-binding subunit